MSHECNQLISVMSVYLYVWCQSKDLIQRLMIWESVGYSSGPCPVIFHKTQKSSLTVQYTASEVAGRYVCQGTVRLSLEQQQSSAPQLQSSLNVIK